MFFCLFFFFKYTVQFFEHDFLHGMKEPIIAIHRSGPASCVRVAGRQAHMEPEDGPLNDDFPPHSPGGFQVSCQVSTAYLG